MESFDVDPAVVARLGAICAALPEVVEEAAWVGARWRVRGRTFAHVLPIVEGRPASYAQASGADGPTVVLTFRITEEERDLFTRPISTRARSLAECTAESRPFRTLSPDPA